MEVRMRIGAMLVEETGRAAAPKTELRGRRFSEISDDTVRSGNQAWIAAGGNRMQEFLEEAAAGAKDGQAGEEQEAEVRDRSEAIKIYEAAVSGGKNPADSIRTAAKVPYGHLAKDGVITYKGVCFVCDERSNSICLGDMSNKAQVLSIPLSGGGSLNVNRANLGDLAKAIGMFSPEDVNLIMRAIAQDTKIQSMQKEIEDMEASVGEQIASGEQAQDGERETA